MRRSSVCRSWAAPLVVRWLHLVRAALGGHRYTCQITSTAEVTRSTYKHQPANMNRLLSRPRDMDATISAPLLGPAGAAHHDADGTTDRSPTARFRRHRRDLVTNPGGIRTQRQRMLERMNWLIQPLPTAMSIGLMLEPTHWLQLTWSSRELAHRTLIESAATGDTWRKFRR